LQNTHLNNDTYSVLNNRYAVFLCKTTALIKKNFEFAAILLHNNIKILPLLHVGPERPSGHLHVYVPFVFIHVPLYRQGSTRNVHSFISAKETFQTIWIYQDIHYGT